MSSGQPQRIAIIGGLGYLGLHLTQFFQDQHQVFIIDANATHPARTQAVENGNLAGSVTILDDQVLHAATPSISQSILPRIDCLFYAATVKDLDETRRWLNWAVQHQVGRIIFLSSAAVYGHQHRPVAETSPASDTLTAYAKLKWAEEAYLRALTPTVDIPIVCLRLFNIYGCTLKSRLMSQTSFSLIDTLLEQLAQTPQPQIRVSDHPTPDQSFQRDYVHIADLMDVCDVILSQPERLRAYEVLNVGTSQATSLHELIDLIEAMTHRTFHRVRAPAPSGEVSYAVADTQQCHAVLGWQARISLAEGLRQHYGQYYAA